VSEGKKKKNEFSFEMMKKKKGKGKGGFVYLLGHFAGSAGGWRCGRSEDFQKNAVNVFEYLFFQGRGWDLTCWCQIHHHHQMSVN
jgi:hypothetical protein